MISPAVYKLIRYTFIVFNEAYFVVEKVKFARGKFEKAKLRKDSDAGNNAKEPERLCHSSAGCEKDRRILEKVSRNRNCFHRS